MKVLLLCEKYKEGNERNLASAYFSIGICNGLIRKNMEAKKAFEDASLIYKDLIIKKLKILGQEIDDNVTSEKLIEPSIFDDDDVKGLKLCYKDMLL